MESALAQLRREWSAIESLVANQNLGLAVPDCPQWNVGDLVLHVGRVQHFFAEMVRSGRDRPFPLSEIAAPSENDVITWAQQGRDNFVAEVLAHGSTAFAWSWTQDKTVAWVQRRLLHETLVHRWDLENAVGNKMPTDAAVASDCIDEFLVSFVVGRKSDNHLPAGSVHLHCTDTEGEWLLKFSDQGIELTREHAKGDVAIRGKAEDLARLLWRRMHLNAGAFEVFGNVEVADSFLAYPRL